MSMPSITSLSRFFAFPVFAADLLQVEGNCACNQSTMGEEGVPDLKAF